MTDEDRLEGSNGRITVLGDTKQNGCQKNAHVCERKSPETGGGIVIADYGNIYYMVFVQLLTIVGSNFPLEIVSKSVECK